MTDVHDTATMTVEEHRALWDAFYAATRALEAAPYPEPKTVRESDGHYTLVCPWCGNQFATVGPDGAPPEIHRVATSVIYQGVRGIEYDRDARFDDTRYVIEMTEGSEPGEDPVSFTCDECDHGISLPGEVEWA